jgi:hypothetical protein
VKITQVEAFQVQWAPTEKPSQRSAFVRVHTDAGLIGLGEASPMQGGRASLAMIVHDIAPMLIGHDPLDHTVLLDQAMHTLVKLGPEGALTGALAALDIALWDLKGKLTGLPIYKLLGGAWRTALPFYASIGGNGDRSLDDVVRTVEARLRDKPAAVKIRFDNNRTTLDADIPGDIAKAGAVRKLVGDAGESGECLPGDEACEEVIVPGGDFTAQAQRILTGGGSQKVVGHVFDGGEVGGCVVGSHAALVVAEHHVHHPVEAVLDGPVAAHDGADQGRHHDQRCEIKPCLMLDFSVCLAAAFDHHDRL